MKFSTSLSVVSWTLVQFHRVGLSTLPDVNHLYHTTPKHIAHCIHSMEGEKGQKFTLDNIKVSMDESLVCMNILTELSPAF